MVVDYYILRGRTLDIAKLYDENGPYAGVNWGAIIASLVGAVVALSFSAVSWYASLIPAGLTYWLLMTYWAPCRRFRT
jgi:NCS1 family nucleobase:cation symporter-1